jgi:plastocyanin
MKKRFNNIEVGLLIAVLSGLSAARPVFATDHVVNMTSGLRYVPADLTIDVGDTVTWVNQDSGDCHDAVSANCGWQIPCIALGEQSSLTFTNTATCPYEDSLYGPALMKGTITVSYLVPRLSAPMRPNDSQFQFTISGVSGKTYVIECSGTLTNWTAIATNVAPSEVFTYTNSNATDLTQFYRVRKEP